MPWNSEAGPTTAETAESPIPSKSNAGSESGARVTYEFVSWLLLCSAVEALRIVAKLTEHFPNVGNLPTVLMRAAAMSTGRPMEMEREIQLWRRRRYRFLRSTHI